MTLKWVGEDYWMSFLAHPSELFLPSIVFELFYNSNCRKPIITYVVPVH